MAKNRKVLLSHGEVCAFARVSYTTIRRMLADGRLINESPGTIAMSEFRRVFGAKAHSYAKQCLAIKAELFKDEEEEQ